MMQSAKTINYRQIIQLMASWISVEFRLNSGQKCSPEPEPEPEQNGDSGTGTGTGTGIPVDHWLT